MNVRVVTTPWQSIEADWLIVGVPEEVDFSPPLAELDKASGGRLTRLREAGDLTGKQAELLAIRDAAPLAAKRLLLIGLGTPTDFTVPRFEKACLTAVRNVSEKKWGTVAIALPLLEAALSEGQTPPSATDLVQTIALAGVVGSLGQGIYKAEPSRFPIENLVIAVPASADAPKIEAAAHRGQILGEAMNVTRELVNRPAQDIYPETLAQRVKELAQDFGLNCGVFDEAWLKQQQMGALLAVAQGSERPPRMVVLEYDGAGDGSPRLAFIGKGVTFDSGGLSIKPTDGMLTMKCDMAGSATVLGAMIAIARLKLPVNVSGYMGLVENMISGNSYKLGDVLTARTGTTIEVNNTDAEGRLVLADVLSYAVDEGSDCLIDLATLTGACVVALGDEIAGVFTNDQPWCDQVLAAAKRAGEDIWQLPMFDYFAEQLKSDVADLKNTGGRPGGSITAAKFLEKFVDKKPWVHLDIAGPAFAGSSKPYREGGGTGCMVRTLVEVAAGFRK
ncbi:MAG TPA: leucyl aminopeptidase [Planctomycetaceae bacterium]|jgi:leucyl aminopeptidase|nr:leucyl aminopeptidase [Planctomycetaceae bacterium]